MSHIDPSSLKHFSVCFLFSLVGAYGMSVVLGASLTKEWYDKKSYGHWCWFDILFDVLGCVAGMSVHWWIFNNNFSPTHITVKCKIMYIGIKFVDARPMSASEAKEKGYRVENNNGEGYEVTYEDGYKSWCPKHVFDKTNAEVKNEELASTCKMMVSPDYKERFKAEYIQIKNRYEGLKAMIEKWDANNLPFVPTCPRETYNFQLRAMKDYMDILVVRAKIEGVTL